jgi:transcriptional regulator with XRE-family HTH domain
MKDNNNKHVLTIGQRLAKYRKGRGLSQVELAEKVGVVRSIIADYERGKIRLNDKIIIKITSILHISADELIGISNNGKNHFIPSLRLMRRFKQIDKLPENKKKAIIKTIDDLIKANTS